jgi:subtilase family serine protease
VIGTDDVEVEIPEDTTADVDASVDIPTADEAIDDTTMDDVVDDTNITDDNNIDNMIASDDVTNEEVDEEIVDIPIEDETQDKPEEPNIDEILETVHLMRAEGKTPFEIADKYLAMETENLQRIREKLGL